MFILNIWTLIHSCVCLFLFTLTLFNRLCYSVLWSLRNLRIFPLIFDSNSLYFSHTCPATVFLRPWVISCRINYHWKCNNNLHAKHSVDVQHVLFLSVMLFLFAMYADFVANIAGSSIASGGFQKCQPVLLAYE